MQIENVSVVIPCYNAEAYIVEALDSVIAQTRPVSEIVVVNDGSTDNSLTLIEAFSARQARGLVRIISQPNMGVATALTVSIENASHNHVIPMGADDLLHPRAVELLLNYAHLHPEHALIYGDYYLMDQAGNVTGEIRHSQRRCDPLEGNILATMLWENVTGAGNCIRRDAVLSVGGYLIDPKISKTGTLADVLLNYRLLLAGHTFGYVPEFIFYYRNTPGSVSKNRPQVQAAMPRVMAEVFRMNPHITAEAFVQMRQWRAEQLRDSFLTIEARDQQIEGLLQEIEVARRYQRGLEERLEKCE